MAERHWIGATNGTWNNTANWSATQGGAGGVSVPTTGDDVYIDKTIAANSYINVNQNIGAINSLRFTDYSTGNVAWYLGGGTSTTTLGTAWTVPTGITIDVATGTYVLGVLNLTLSGTPNIIKTGGGGLLRSSPTTGSWGTATFDVQGGWIGASGVTNALGTGAITFSNGTGISAAIATVSLGNPLTVNGDIFVNRYLDSTTTALGSLTATGAVSLGSSQRTLTVGGTGAANVNSASFTGVVSGTGGFIVDGDPSSFIGNQATLRGLRLTNTGNTVSGPVVTKNVLELGTYATPPATSGNVLPSVSNIEINGNSAWLRIISNTSMTTPTFSGTGNVVLYGSLGVNFTCPPGAFTSLNTSSATYGLWVLAAYGFNIDVTDDLPSKVYWDGVNSSANATAIRYLGTSGSPKYWNTDFTLDDRIASNATRAEIQASGSSGSSIIITGTISRGAAGTQDLRLAGTNTNDNTISGVISTALSVEKSNTGKWVLSGNNTFTGGTFLSGGTLTIANQNAIQNSTITYQTAGTTLSLDPTLTAATFGGLAGTLTAGVTLTVPAGLTLSIGNNNTTTSYANILAGSGNLTKIGTGTLTLTNTGNTLSGTATINAGTLILGGTAQSGLTLPSISSIVLGSTSVKLSVLSNQAETFSKPITGTGNAYFQCTNASGMTIDSAVWSGLTNSSATIGAGVAAYHTITSRINISNFPPKLAYYLDGASPTANIYYSNAAPATNINVINLDMSAAPTGTVTAGLYNSNASTSDILVQSGNVSTTGAGTVTFSLRGSNTGNNEISGIISNPTGTVNINKNDAGKWILSGNNTFTGTITVAAGELKLSGSNSTSAATTLSGGTLTIANQNAIQNSTITHQTAGTTLSFDPALTAVTFGGLSGTLVAGVTFNIPSGLNLSIGNNNAATTYANLITGSGTLTKVGSGQTTLTGNNTGFNGNLVSSGSSGTLLTGSFTAVTDAIPAISSVTMNDGIVLTTSTTSKTITYNITFNSPIPSNLYTGSSYFGSGGVSSGDTVLHTYTGTISGTGVFALWAPNASVAATRYVRTKTSSLPSTLGMAVNSWTQFRRATYEWGGGNYDVGTNVLLDALDSDVATSNDTRGIFSIVHRGTTDTEFVLNNINKTSGTAVTFGSYLRLGSASDVGDIRVKGVISQSVSSLGIDKQGPRKLTLSGANTYTFNTLLSGGELVIANANALQNSTFVNQTAGTTLTFDPSLSAATFGGLSGTLTAGAGFTIPSGFNLSIGNNNANTDYYNLLLGTGTLTKIGTGSQGFYDTSLSSFTGNIVLNSAFINFYGSSFGAMTVSQTSGSRTAGYVNFRPTVTNGYSFPAGFTLSGTGLFVFLSTNVTSLTTGFTLPAGATAGLTGTSAGSAATSATTGLVSITETAVVAQRNNTINLNDFPSVLTYEFVVNSASIAQTHNIYYIASGASHSYPTRIDIINYSGSVGGAGAQTANLYANQGSGALVLSGGINRYSTISYSVTLHLRGTNDQYNEISGNITQTSGTLAINKTDSGTWVLSGTNTYTAGSTLTSGILNVRNNNALGSSTSGNVTLTSGTLEIQGNISLNKSTPSVAFNGSIIKNVSGSNSFITGSSALGAATTFNIDADSLTFPGVITGSNIAYSVNKTGTGTMRLSSVSNSYIGPTAVRQGIMEFISVNDAGSASNSSLGKPAIAQSDITLGEDGSAGLSHIGTTAASTNRNLIFSGATGTDLTIDSSGTGSGAITYSSGGTLSFTGAGTHTAIFSGTSSNQNYFSRTISNGGSGATSILKNGSTTWNLSAVNATGSITCSGGILNFTSTDVTSASSLIINSGTVSGNSAGTGISTNITMNGGKLTIVPYGFKTLDVSSSATEISPAVLETENAGGTISITGNVTISGCLDVITPNAVDPATSGTAKMFGLNNTVTIASGGIIRTKYSPSSNQNGKAKYYNLVLQNNSKIKIGFAA